MRQRRRPCKSRVAFSQLRAIRIIFRNAYLLRMNGDAIGFATMAIPSRLRTTYDFFYIEIKAFRYAEKFLKLLIFIGKRAILHPNQRYGYFYFNRCSVHYLRFEFGKNTNSFYVNFGTESILRSNCLATIGVCVFRALTSVGALFYFIKILVCGGKL